MNRSAYRYFKIRNVLVIILMLFFQANYAETGTQDKSKIEVKGIVVDAHTKKPINAVRISALNVETSAVTDENGNFSIRINSLTDVLNIEAFDYGTLEVPVKGRNYIAVEMYPDQFTNYFQGINIATGLQRHSSVSNSIGNLSDFSNSPALSPDELLHSLNGDVRTISRTGLSGAGSSLFIRGLNSINANAQPLFVVDGVIWNTLYDAESIKNGFFSNTLNNIDVNDIESITVLKDGASIYGSKGANGVILINTKRAKSIVTKINANIFAGLHTQPEKLPIMNGEQFRVYASDMLQTQGASPKDISNYGFLETDPSNAMTYNMYHNNTDWSKEVYRQGSSQNYNVNVSGGDDKALYYFSIGYSGNNDVVKEADMSRINTRFNADIKLTNTLSLGANIAYSQINRNSFDDGITYSSVTWMSKIKAPFLSPYGFSSTGSILKDYDVSDVFNVGNPSGVLAFYDKNSVRNYRLNFGVSPSIKLSPELTFSTQIDYSLDKTAERGFVPRDYTPAVLIPDYNSYSKSMANNQVIRNISIFDETKLTYNKTFDKIHNLKAILGWRYLNNSFEADYAEGHNAQNTNPFVSSSLDFLTVNGTDNSTKSIAGYLNGDYNYDNKYFATATVSMDASSRFGKKTKEGISLFGRSWAIFPSLSAGWNISSETFMKDLRFIDFLKLRAGFGLTGNDGIQDYAAMNYFSVVKYMSRGSGLAIANLENSKLQWETTAKANIGLDMNLFNNRFSGTIDVFSSNTSNLLMLKTLPEVVDAGSYWTNSGKMSNKGFEATINTKILNLKDLTWELGFSIGHYKNKITSLPNGSYTTSVYGGEVLTQVGSPAGVFYGYKTKGVFASADEATVADLKILNTDGSYSSFGAGDIHFEEVAKDGIIDKKDKQIIGDPNPDFYGNISTKLVYRRFTLNALFTYSYGNDVYNYQRQMLESGADFSNQTKAMLRRWTAEGQVTSQPKAYYGDPMGNSRFSDRWIEDGSYLRLKTISLAYDVPYKNNFINGITIWTSVNNLFTVTKYLGLDPEFSARNSVYYQGVDAGFLPLSKSFYLGIKLSL